MKRYLPCSENVPGKRIELVNEEMMKITLSGAAIELNLSIFFPIITDSNRLPHRKVVMINDTGVKGLFHDITVGIKYNFIMLYINAILNTMEITEKILSDFVYLFFVTIIRYNSRVVINREIERISLLSQLVPRLFIALNAFRGFPRWRNEIASERKRRTAIMRRLLFLN